MLSVRASEEEIGRVKKLAAELMRKHRYLKESDVIRELIGLEDTGLITNEMRKKLLGKPVDDTDVIERLKGEAPLVTKADKN